LHFWPESSLLQLIFFAIVGDRGSNGPFASCDDLTRVSGVGPTTVNNLRNRCTVK
jgi:DNA uptake protein ComE-like DNA-binding protein